MIRRVASCLTLACVLAGCGPTSNENTLPPDPNAEPKATPPVRKGPPKPPPSPEGNGMKIQ